ncbi:IS6 family transposase [Ochrobactrum sp. Marseille-Q0166]|uniref:IS6 family transposase n=1 Tax=Ochrobactrum sp. Marseille-Q0166 TaxID=2761105 RepID=UPI001654F044|nr:IS6 family transposase [Ochrobactrum sp. Marseille-Q0166]MBC8719908.1 IS6 family transposase [Ochrobactrum sp. Marseille-Q0166]
MAVDFKGAHFPKSVILYAVFFYLRYPASYRDLQEIMAERGVDVDHATLNRWVVRYAPQIADQAQKRKRPTSGSWRVDETYIKVKGNWTYLYRAVDRDGQTLDFMLSERRNIGTARRFFRKAIASNGVPNKIVIDKSGANLAGAQAINTILKITGTGKMIEILQAKYLNNILEQDHRFIKRITKHTLGFKAFHSASATIAGIEVAHMIRKKQFANNNRSPFKVFAQLAA